MLFGSNSINSLKIEAKNNQELIKWSAFIDGIKEAGSLKGTFSRTGEIWSLVLDNSDMKIENSKLIIKEGSKINFGKGIISASPFNIQIGEKGNVGLEVSYSDVLKIKGNIKDLSLSNFNTYINGADFFGVLSGDFLIGGKLDKPYVDANFDFSKFSVAHGAGKLIPVNITLKSKMHNKILKWQLNTYGANSSKIKVNSKGSVNIANLKLKNAIQGTFKTELQISALSSFASKFGLVGDGKTIIDLYIKGSSDKIATNGSLSIGNASIVEGRSGIVIDKLNVISKFNQSKLVISRITGKVRSGGSFNGKGSMQLPIKGKKLFVDFNLLGKGVTYADGRLFESKSDLSLFVKGGGDKTIFVKGDINVKRFLFHIPSSLPLNLELMKVTHKNVSRNFKLPKSLRDDVNNTESTNNKEENLKILLDFKVKADKTIFVLGRGVDANMLGNISIQGSILDPNILGSFGLVKGKLGIGGKIIRFERAGIKFFGPAEPILDFSASTKVEDMIMFINIKGPASRFKIELASQPSLPQEEIMAKLLFGKSVSKLSPVQAVRIAEALGTLMGYSVTQNVIGALRDITGIDDLNISVDDKGKTTVSAGKSITDKIYVKVTKGSEPGEEKVSIDYKINDKLSLELDKSRNGKSAATVTFGTDY